MSSRSDDLISKSGTELSVQVGPAHTVGSGSMCFDSLGQDSICSHWCKKLFKYSGSGPVSHCF